MTEFLLGVDGGASKTRCLVTSLEGTIISSGCGGCANRNITSPEAATLQVRLGVIEALAKGGILPTDIASAYYGLGGIATEKCQQEWVDAVHDLTPQATITVENDVFLAIHAVDEEKGIGVVSGSGGNIGAVTSNGTFHLNGHVHFNSSQLGRSALQVIMLQIHEQEHLNYFAQSLLELAGIDEKRLRQRMLTHPQDLAREVSPLLIQLYQQGHKEAQEIVHSWLDLVSEDVQRFQLTNNLEALPICFGGATFSAMHSVLENHLHIQGRILVATISLAEGAIKAAKRQIAQPVRP